MTFRLINFCTKSNYLPRNLTAFGKKRLSSSQSPLLPLQSLPGPKGTAANMYELMRSGGIANLCEIQRKRFERYGPIFLEKLFNRYIVNVSDAEAMATVLRAEPSFPKRPGFEAFEKCLEDHDHVSGMASNDRDAWYKERSLISTKMMRPKEVNQFLPGFNQVAADVIERMRTKQRDNVVIDLETELFYWAAETICTFLFDQRLGFYNHPPDKRAVIFVDAALELTVALGKLLFGLPLYKYINTPTFNSLRKSVNTIYTLGAEIVIETEKRRKEGDVSGVNTMGTKSLFDHIADSEKFGTKSIVNILCGMMNAGVDTTTIVALWTVYLLSKAPDIQEKLYAELKSVVGSDGVINGGTIDRSPYLKACVKESMRVRPPTVVTPRKLDQDIDILGYHIPAETEIMLYTLILSTSKKHYGENADQFVPDRWVRGSPLQNVPLTDYDAFTTIPFGYGVRMCIGRRIAEAELYSLISQIVLNYRMEYVGKREPKQYITALVKPDIPLEIKFIPR